MLDSAGVVGVGTLPSEGIPSRGGKGAPGREYENLPSAISEESIEALGKCGVRVELFNPDLATDYILKRIPRLFLIE